MDNFPLIGLFGSRITLRWKGSVQLLFQHGLS
jgi:hypothetical protein